jgi:hypothetical protein
MVALIRPTIVSCMLGVPAEIKQGAGVADSGGIAVQPEEETPTCMNESDLLTHYELTATPQLVKACATLWTPGSVPKRTDPGIGGEIKCRKDSYEVEVGKWESPRPAVCAEIEAAAASFGVGEMTPGCGLWLWCLEGSDQWILGMQQTYDF